VLDDGVVEDKVLGDKFVDVKEMKAMADADAEVEVTIPAGSIQGSIKVRLRIKARL
jgi:delta-aminolevulinic acid dehydratase/porphobilinogen synthase